MLSRRPCFNGFSRTLSYSSLYCFVEKTVNVREKMLFYCDNIATVQIIRNGRTKEPLIMKFIRRLTTCIMPSGGPALENKVTCICDMLSYENMLLMNQLHQVNSRE